MKSINVCFLLCLMQNINAQINDSDSLGKSNKSLDKKIELGYYDTYENLPKLKFEILSEKEFNTYSYVNEISSDLPQQKGQYYYIPDRKSVV